MFDFESIIGFDWDEGNKEKNREKHQLDFRECEEVFFNQPLLLSEDIRHSFQEKRYYDAEALAFDLYGTLVDPIPIWKQLEHDIPGDAQRIAEIWRQKQLEFTFRLTAMEQYEDFEQVTRKALDYALAATGHSLETRQKNLLMAQYNNLESFADVGPGLQRLKEAGYSMVVFSNGSPGMLAGIMNAANLNPYFKGFVSVDEVKVYKPSPIVYRHVANKLGRHIDEVRLISSNPFDVIGAEAAGMRTAWVNRTDGLFDTLAPMPQTVVKSLVELANRLATI